MQKFKTVIKLIVISLILTSCGKSDFECNSTIAKSTVKSIWKDAESKNRFAYGLYGIKSNEVNDFIDQYMSIEQVRTISKNDELKRCECAGKVVFNMPDEVKANISEIKNKKGLMGFAIAESLTSEDGIDIEYNVQETEEGEIYAETYTIDNLSEKIMFYKNLLSSYEKLKTLKEYKKGVVLNFASKVNNGENKYKLTFLNDNKLDIEYRYFDYKQNETAIFENGEIIVTDLPDDFPIAKNKFYILKDDIFKAYNPESGEYDLHYADK